MAAEGQEACKNEGKDQVNDSKLPVTVAVPVKNEEDSLATCLKRLDRFGEIVVIDSGSTDRTVEIAKEFGAKVLQFQWDGRYPKKRNWMLLTHPPEQPWVLFLDADEVVDDTFCEELERVLNDTRHSGFWVSYANTFRGRPLRHGLQQRKLALFRVGQGLYERIDEEGWSTLDMEIHEHPIVDGSVGELSAQIEHRDDRGLAHFLHRHVDYANWEAHRLSILKSDAAAWDRLTKRQKFKYRHIKKWWYPFFYFMGTYIWKKGILDGAAGFEYSFYKSWYFYTIRLMLKDTA